MFIASLYLRSSEAERNREEYHKRGGHIFNNMARENEDLAELHKRNYNILSDEETAILHAAALVQKKDSADKLYQESRDLFVRKEPEPELDLSAEENLEEGYISDSLWDRVFVHIADLDNN